MLLSSPTRGLRPPLRRRPPCGGDVRPPCGRVAALRRRPTLTRPPCGGGLRPPSYSLRGSREPHAPRTLSLELVRRPAVACGRPGGGGLRPWCSSTERAFDAAHHALPLVLLVRAPSALPPLCGGGPRRLPTLTLARHSICENLSSLKVLTRGRLKRLPTLTLASHRICESLSSQSRSSPALRSAVSKNLAV